MPAQAVRNYSGTVDYAGNRAILDDAGTRYVLLIDKPPFGHFDVEDIAAAANLLRGLGVDPGDQLCVKGAASSWGSLNLIQIMRFC